MERLQTDICIDYVCVVLGIFVVLVSLFWLWCRKTFLGPVSTILLCNSISRVVADFIQTFDMLASGDRDAKSSELEKAMSCTSKPTVETIEN